VRRFLEFFAATIRNKNTRIAYYRVVADFSAWLDAAGTGTLVDASSRCTSTPISRRRKPE